VSRWQDRAVATAGGLVDRRGGSLWLEDCAVEGLAERFGTPLFAISEMALRRGAREIRAAFTAAWRDGEVVVMPSVKANYVVAVQRVLAQEGCGADVFGGGELEVTIRAGTDPDLISLNGTCKDLATIRRAVELGARVTLDDVREIEIARRAAQLAGRRASIRVRVRPQLSMVGASERDELPVHEAYARYKPGIPWEDLVAARDDLLAPELDLSGVMMHFGRHSADLDTFGHVVERYAALIGELAQLCDGWTPRTIDVGGGLAQRGDPYGKARPGAAIDREAPPITDCAAMICERLRSGLAAAGIDPAGRRLEVEPGRALFGPCGIHVTSVLNVKRQMTPFPHTWVETDTSQAFLPDVVLESARHPLTLARVEPESQRHCEPVDVVGRSCEVDLLAQGEPLPPVGPGALLVFCLTGAYHEAGASNFNALLRPATVLVRGDAAYAVRVRETIDDVLSRDRIPPHLTGTTTTAGVQ